MHDLWTERYRPETLDGYVFTDQQQRNQIEKWIAEKNIPHLLFSGAAGTGKTIVALHRAVFLARKNPETRVLLTTFSSTLANSLKNNIANPKRMLL